jgi:hypothetical protein
MDSADPSDTKSTTDMLEPILLSPITEAMEPTRAKFLKLIELAKFR